MKESLDGWNEIIFRWMDERMFGWMDERMFGWMG
jgi:hypothetical protein